MATSPINTSSLHSLDLSEFPCLDDKQVGALRHIENLANQPENDWSHMMGRAAMQEDHGAYRYQLAFMAIALALAHRHRLPAAPAVFKDTFDRLINKMVHPEVWLYWRRSSQGKGPLSMSAPKLPQETDPVNRDNIMYSAYVQVMTLLYHTLFGDEKYARPNAIEFKFSPTLCLNDEHAVFHYNEKTLNEHIYWKMVEAGYLGVACEPYCVFQVCNQVPILGFRLHDWLYGGDIAAEVTAGYKEAWNEFGGMLSEDGHFYTVVYTPERNVLTSKGAPWADSWCGMLMNSWNSEFVRANYIRQRDDWLLAGPDDTFSLKLPPPIPGYEMPDGAAGDFGWAVGFASEMGDKETLQGLLAHADRFMAPRWKDGGYFYPRQDRSRDENGNLTYMDPTMGNAMLAYGRLNVPDGLKKLYEEPWQAGHFQEPSIIHVSKNTNLVRAVFLPEHSALVFTFERRSGSIGDAQFSVGNIDQSGRCWKLCQDDIEVAQGTANSSAFSGKVQGSVTNGKLQMSCPQESRTTIVMTWR